MMKLKKQEHNISQYQDIVQTSQENEDKGTTDHTVDKYLRSSGEQETEDDLLDENKNDISLYNYDTEDIDIEENIPEDYNEIENWANLGQRSTNKIKRATKYKDSCPDIDLILNR